MFLIQPDHQYLLDFQKMQDHKEKIVDLIKEIQNNLTTPLGGKGKPEKLKHNFKNCYSRRITQEHRLVYKLDFDKKVIHLLRCRGHY